MYVVHERVRGCNVGLGHLQVITRAEPTPCPPPLVHAYGSPALTLLRGGHDDSLRRHAVVQPTDLLDKFLNMCRYQPWQSVLQQRPPGVFIPRPENRPASDRLVLRGCLLNTDQTSKHLAIQSTSRLSP